MDSELLHVPVDITLRLDRTSSKMSSEGIHYFPDVSLNIFLLFSAVNLNLEKNGNTVRDKITKFIKTKDSF